MITNNIRATFRRLSKAASMLVVSGCLNLYPVPAASTQLFAQSANGSSNDRPTVRRRSCGAEGTPLSF
jgi:hypothetical protein